MLLSHGKHSHTCVSVRFATVHTLSRDDLYRTFLDGRYPDTWKRVNAWVVRRTFSRAVRLLLKVRRARAPPGGRKPLGREAFVHETARLIAIGRGGDGKQTNDGGHHTAWPTTSPALCAVTSSRRLAGAHADPAEAGEHEEFNISQEEFAMLRMKIAANHEDDSYKQRVSSRLGDERGGGRRLDDGAAWTAVARLEGEVRTLGDELTMTQGSVDRKISEVQTSIRELGAQMGEVTALLRERR